MKEDLINKLVETSKKETEKYSNELEGVVNYKCEEFFKKNNPDKGYHSVDANIIFKGFTLKLEYKINVSILLPKSTIEMRFMFEQGKLPVEYSIYDLLNILDKNNFKCYTFAYVISEDKVKEALSYLVETFKTYKDGIEEICVNSEKINMLENAIEDKIDALLNEKIFESKDAFYLMRMLELYYVIDTSRFTMESYIHYLNGKYKKSIKAYTRQKDNLTEYEKRLLSYMQTGNIGEQVPNNLNTLVEAKKLKNAKNELFPMYFSWVVLTPVWSIIYSLIFYIALYFLSKDAIYVGGTGIYMLFLPAFITAIINSFFVRKLTYKIFYRKNYNKMVALDEIENGEKILSVMSKLFQFVIALGIVFALISANTNIMFYENYFNNNLAWLDIKGEIIQYEDVECVYKAKGFTNDFGQVISGDMFVIALKGGTQIDLYYHLEGQEIKENILPIFQKHNIEIKEIDLVENINK